MQTNLEAIREASHAGSWYVGDSTKKPNLIIKIEINKRK